MWADGKINGDTRIEEGENKYTTSSYSAKQFFAKSEWSQYL